MGIWRPGWSPRSFDPVRLGRQEATAWASYYRHDWWTFLRAAVGMVRTGFGTDPVRSVVGAYHVLRANQLWAPYPDNDADGARASMRRFYALVIRDHGQDLLLDPDHAAALEVEWWRLHRERQHDPGVSTEALVQSLVDLYSYVYSAPPETMRKAAQYRVDAMDLSDAWVTAGCDPADPLLTQGRRALVASHTALRRVVGAD
ncbi:MAG: hypothetical protein J2P22_11920 [Nocardioides sp.]|nr:hypothetical protein [Nocardioides sp.]